MLNIKIETERLIIRPFELSDIGPSYELNLDTEVSEFTGDGGVVSREEIERRIKEDVLGDYKKYGYGRFAVELKGVDKFIGFAGLKYLEDYELVDLGYRFKKEHWGKGIGTEAAKACIEFGFNELELEQMSAFVLPLNIGSIRVLEKNGFTFKEQIMEEGILMNRYDLVNRTQKM